ncbi:MAG: Nif3-like dinuclear metal center hexameric protein [Halobacteriovoraceae bacterium]|nr:Nif3-like dinuclear metal center hexameric protein [Halobacteriovoraceae bacterium]
MTISRKDLEFFLDNLLVPSDFVDYGPNGLQVEGESSIKRIAFAVSATRDSILKTLENKAQALVVHHGLFWKFHGARPLKGAFGKRVLPLAQHNINLFAYHLPLDAHMEVGNAGQIARLIGLQKIAAFGSYEGKPLGVQGRCSFIVKDLRAKLENILRHPVILSTPDDKARIKSLGIITGGANSEWTFALQDNLDAYLTGEISEHDWHEAKEAGIHFFAGGHHATEQFGIQALMKKVEEKFSVDCFYIDSENPA